ncbi:GyrI-like domain-containing protein [Ensifer sp.]|jgi:effector-binding domain-containing protein|uniref:GyrI-like domain-containing protein n=1 Tax=Ensifer sp. TaxID=1872086 RepID=UPI002E1314F7|nr:GyrI-like domain-containing protein [Ensifer sp.]
MHIKETDAMRVLSVARQLTIPQVKTESAVLAPAIEAEMDRAGLKPAGPWIFIAQNLPKDAKTPFDWRICRPVTGGDDYRGNLDLIELEPVMVASARHQGPMRSLFTQGYAPLITAIEMSRHNFSGESREIYHRWAGQGARYHEIEIQFGLAN